MKSRIYNLTSNSKKVDQGAREQTTLPVLDEGTNYFMEREGFE